MTYTLILRGKTAGVYRSLRHLPRRTATGRRVAEVGDTTTITLFYTGVDDGALTLVTHGIDNIRRDFPYIDVTWHREGA
jgi:hypothetical protein